MVVHLQGGFSPPGSQRGVRCETSLYLPTSGLPEAAKQRLCQKVAELSEMLSEILGQEVEVLPVKNKSLGPNGRGPGTGRRKSICQ